MARLRMLAVILGCQFDDLRQRDKERRTRNMRLLSILIVTVLLVVGGLGTATWTQTQREREQASFRSVAEAYRILYRAPIQAAALAHQALQEKPSNVASAALDKAHRIALQHRNNQKDAETLTTTQAFSFEERYREGKVYTVLSRDGQYVLLTTERRGDPYNPELPGEVYLLNNETLQSRKLERGTSEAANGRLEYAGFSVSGLEVFLTRGFYVYIYDFNANSVTGDPLLFQGTKSPIHVVGGRLNGKYLLGGDSIGGVWLMDVTRRQPTRSIDSLSGSKGNAVVAVTLSPDGKAATLVYESGRVDLVEFGQTVLPYHWSVLSRGGLSTAFPASNTAFRFLTAEKSGWVRVWTAGYLFIPSNSFSVSP